MEITQSKIAEILDNIKNEKSYYAGGTLCVDKILPNDDVLMMNLSEEFFAFAEGSRGLLNTENTKKLYAIYKEHKGETRYYKEEFAKSHIRHLM